MVQTEKRKIALGMTGSIAAYKGAELVRLLVSRGYEVRVVMTPSAEKFITPLTMQALSGNPVMTSMWSEVSGQGMGHIELAEWADAFFIAPASADFIARLVAGLADNALLASLLVTRAPVLIAPAMNVNMLEHTVTQENISRLKERGIEFVDTEEGAMACGWEGNGRLADTWELFWQVRRVLTQPDFAGKKVVITTGPTREPLDPVRFVSNRSSGKMGIELAREAHRRGASVTLVHGPVNLHVPRAVECIPVVSAEEMQNKVFEETFQKDDPADIVIMVAAVADYRPEKVEPEKVKKTETARDLHLVRNPDILQTLGEKRGDENHPVLVGFSMETGEIDDLLQESRRKLDSKHADMIVGNFALDAFDLDTNRVWLIDKHGRQEEIATTFKSRVSMKILDVIQKLL